jgi:hydrogenase maturation protease
MKLTFGHAHRALIMSNIASQRHLGNRSSKAQETLVLGLGNLLLTDEGIGIHVLDYLARNYPTPGVAFVDGGTLSFTLATYIEAAHVLIVVDAVELGEEPGAVRTFCDAEMDRFLQGPRRSAHELNLADLIDTARITDRLPARRALVGIQPAEVGWGEEPSPMVAAAIPHAAAEVLTLLKTWID